MKLYCTKHRLWSDVCGLCEAEKRAPVKVFFKTKETALAEAEQQRDDLRKKRGIERHKQKTRHAARAKVLKKQEETRQERIARQQRIPIEDVIEKNWSVTLKVYETKIAREQTVVVAALTQLEAKRKAVKNIPWHATVVRVMIEVS